MKSIKKVALLLAALAAVMAVTGPATAGAATLSYEPKLQPKVGIVPVGTAVTAKSTNWKSATPIGNIRCAALYLQGKVTKNSGGAAEVTGTGPEPGTECVFGETGVNVSAEMTNLTLTTSKTIGVKLTYEGPGGNCTYENSAVSVFYTSGASQFDTSGALKQTPWACISFTFNARFSLTSKTGTPIYIH